MNAQSIVRIQAVHPKLSDKVVALSAALDKMAIEIRITQGLRTWAEQDALFNQKPQVTKARGGHSWHNFGLAVDVVPDDVSLAGFQCDWNISHPVWQTVERVAKSLGFTCGAEFRSFPDWPHLQLTGRFPVSPNDEVRELFNRGGLPLVWKESGL